MNMYMRQEQIVLLHTGVLCGLMDGVQDLADVSSHHFLLQGKTHTHTLTLPKSLLINYVCRANP